MYLSRYWWYATLELNIISIVTALFWSLLLALPAGLILHYSLLNDGRTLETSVPMGAWRLFLRHYWGYLTISCLGCLHWHMPGFWASLRLYWKEQRETRVLPSGFPDLLVNVIYFPIVHYTGIGVKAYVITLQSSTTGLPAFYSWKYSINTCQRVRKLIQKTSWHLWGPVSLPQDHYSRKRMRSTCHLSPLGRSVIVRVIKSSHLQMENAYYRLENYR